MIDLHYDLLSILYYCYLKNDFSYIETIQKYYQNNGVRGVVANLYFMNEEEMKEELGELYEPIDVVEMFRIATTLFRKYFPELDVIYSIEGCDYIDNLSQQISAFQQTVNQLKADLESLSNGTDDVMVEQ